MNKKLLQLVLATILISLSAATLTAQNKFKAGYYLDNAGQQINGYVKNVDWKNSPNSIDFRITPEGDTETLRLNQIQGFGIDGQVDYVKKTFELDVTSDNLNNLNFSKDPEFETRTGFLEVIVAGPTSLYFYENGGLREYFLSQDDESVEALVYVRYLKDKKVASNNQYKQQLANAMKECSTLSFSDFENLSYSRNSLRKLFENYNVCMDPNYVVERKTKTTTLLNVNVFAGFNSSSYNVKNAASARLGGDFGGQTNLRFGAELEVVLPFNNNGFALYLGFAKNGNFESTITQELSSVNTPEQEVTLTVNTVNMPIGARYYIPVNPDVKISLEAGYHVDIVSEISIERAVTANDFNTTNGSYGYLSIGAGAKYKQFFGRANVDIGKDPFAATTFQYSSDVPSFNFVLGYQIPLIQ
ncbi:hypothetical protein [Gilvibacter sediminis]|uniref:hypothetical protein n=1 Tax=Gilvibacter sediminis TaxID=379071 RepID=UPI002350DA42|nr:hypothetical protein [Gilvibacter sediminis]MDC7997457.1 hypothetical protein [Gilvibacter sediminis]